MAARRRSFVELMPKDQEAPSLETLYQMLRSSDDKFMLLMAEAEKRNGQRFDAQQEAVSTAMTAAEKAVSAAMAAAEKAVTKAEVAAEKRFEAVNEFRQTLSDQQGTFLTRTEYSVQHESLGEKVDTIIHRTAASEKAIGEIRERGAGHTDVWGILLGSVGVMISVGTIVLLLLRGTH